MAGKDSKHATLPRKLTGGLTANATKLRRRISSIMSFAEQDGQPVKDRLQSSLEKSNSPPPSLELKKQLYHSVSRLSLFERFSTPIKSIRNRRSVAAMVRNGKASGAQQQDHDGDRDFCWDPLYNDRSTSPIQPGTPSEPSDTEAVPAVSGPLAPMSTPDACGIPRLELPQHQSLHSGIRTTRRDLLNTGSSSDDPNKVSPTNATARPKPPISPIALADLTNAQHVSQSAIEETSTFQRSKTTSLKGVFASANANNTPSINTQAQSGTITCPPVNVTGFNNNQAQGVTDSGPPLAVTPAAGVYVDAGIGAAHAQGGSGRTGNGYSQTNSTVQNFSRLLSGSAPGRLESIIDPNRTSEESSRRLFQPLEGAFDAVEDTEASISMVPSSYSQHSVGPTVPPRVSSRNLRQSSASPPVNKLPLKNELVKQRKDMDSSFTEASVTTSALFSSEYDSSIYSSDVSSPCRRSSNFNMPMNTSWLSLNYEDPVSSPASIIPDSKLNDQFGEQEKEELVDGLRNLGVRHGDHIPAHMKEEHGRAVKAVNMEWGVKMGKEKKRKDSFRSMSYE